MSMSKKPQTFAPGYARQRQIVEAEKAAAKAKRAKVGKKSYWEQAVDYGDKAPASKEEKEFFDTQKAFRQNILRPATESLLTGAWKQNGIDSKVENEIDKAQKAGYISLEEKRKYTSLASEKLMQARKTKVVSGNQVHSGREHVSGRSFSPDWDAIKKDKVEKNKQYKKQLLAEQAKLPSVLREAGAMASAGAGTIAGLGLGAAKSVVNLGRTVTLNETFNDAYNFLDEGEKKYLQGAADTGKENLFLESMYGSSGEIEKIVASPAIVGGELGRIAMGRGIGALQGPTAKKQFDDNYASLGIGDWYAQRTGDPDNLLRQASALSGGIIAGTVPGAGLDLLTMKFAGTAFAAATRPVVKTMIQSQVARTAGSMVPMAVGGLGTAGIPGQVTKAFGGTPEQAERANIATQFAGRPLAAAVEAIPVQLQTTEGQVIDARAQKEQRMAQLDPNGIAQTAATVGLFGSGIGSFYKDARQLFKVNRLLAKANATQYQGRFLNAGDRLLREKTELIGSVGPDAAFGINNAFEPIAQTYRAITDQTLTETGEKAYKLPTMSDIGRAALLTFTAVRPAGKLSAFMTPALRGKVLGQGSDIKTEATLVARDWVDSGGWRSDVVQQRFKQLTGKDANPDDVKRVVSAAYEMIAEPARQAVISGEVLPTHAAEVFFQKLLTGRALDDAPLQEQFNKLVTSMRVKGDKAPLSDNNPLLQQRINENIFVVDPKAKSKAIAELTPHVEKRMLDAMKASSQPAEKPAEPATGAPEQQAQQRTAAPRSQQQQFFAVRIEDAADGVPQYLAFNPHRGPDGYTFRSQEIVRGDEDTSDLIFLDQPTVNRKSAFYTAEQLVKALSSRLDIFNPFNSRNRWSSGGKTKSIAGFNPGGQIMLKTRTRDGNVSVETVGSVDLMKELSADNLRLLDTLRPILTILNTATESEAGKELLDFTESQDFPDKVPFTSEDGQVRFVNGRLIETAGGTQPMGIYQLPDGTIYMQPLSAEQAKVQTKTPLSARQLEQSPDTANTQTIKDARVAVDSQIGYIRMDIHDTGLPAKVPVSIEVLDLLETVLDGAGTLEEKAQTIRNIVAEDYALNVAGTRQAMRMDPVSGELINDVDVQVGDLVSGAFTTESDLEKAIVIKSDNNLVTVRLLSDPTGDAYTVPVDNVIIESQADRGELQTRLDNFKPTDDVPYHRPWTRTLTDEEEFNTYMALRSSKNQRSRIEGATAEELPGILLDVVKSGNAFSGDVKLGLISWAAANQNVEAVLDAVVGVYDDAIKPGATVYNYLVRVADLYGDSGFMEQLYYLDGLMSLGKSGALLSAQSIQSRSTAHAIARRMNILAYRSNTIRTPEALYAQAVKSLNVIDTPATRRDAIAYAYQLRGIAPHAAYHADNMWQMRTLAGASPEMQVFLGRAVAVASDPAGLSLITSAGFDPILTRFWTSERAYKQAVMTVQKKIASQDPFEVKSALSDLGLEFLWYAATEQRRANTVKSINEDANAYREWQRKLNTYVTNQAIPTIVLKAIESDISSGDFMGYVDEATVHQTNQVSFIQVIAKFGEDITRSVANSELIDTQTKTDLLTALNNLRGQIQDMSPEQLANIATYRPSNITGNVEYTLLSDGSANDLGLVQYQQTIDRAAQMIIDQALTEEDAAKIRDDMAEDFENDPTAAAAARNETMDRYDITELARRSAYEKLRSGFAVTQLARALGHFTFEDPTQLKSHVARWEDHYGVRSIQDQLNQALTAKNDAEINRLSGELSGAKQQAFASAYRSLNKVLDVAGDLVDTYESILKIDTTELRSVYDVLRNAFDDYQNDYFASGSIYAESYGTLDLAGSRGGARVVRQASEEGGADTAESSAQQLSDLNPDELDDYKKKINQEKEVALTKAVQSGKSEQYQLGIAKYYDNLLKRITGNTLATATSKTNTLTPFSDALTAFNEYISAELPNIIDMSDPMSMADSLTIIGNMSAEMLGLISKDIFTGPQKITQIKNNVLNDVSREYSRTRNISEDVQALRQSSAPIEITEDIESGTITLTGLTMNALNGRKEISEHLRSIDNLNHDALSADPTIGEADLMFDRDAIDLDMAAFLDPAPVISIQAMESDLVDDVAFDGMATSTIPDSQRVKLYSLHARNYEGMRTLLESLLLRQFDFESTDEAVADLGESVNTQRGLMSNGAFKPQRSGSLGEQSFFDNEHLVNTAQTLWAPRLRLSTEQLIKSLGVTSGTRQQLNKIIPEIDTILANAGAYIDVNTLVSDLSNAVARTIDTARIDPDIRSQMIMAFSETAILDVFNKPDLLGTTYSHIDGYVDTPYQIATAITALSSDVNSEYYVSFLHPKNLPSILSEPTADGLAAMTPATAEQLYKMYSKIDMDRYGKTTQESIERIKSLYLQRSQYQEKAAKVERDRQFIGAARELSAGLAKTYDNFAYGYGKQQYAMLLTSSLPEHRAIIADAMVKVGVDTRVVNYFKGKSGSLDQILSEGQERGLSRGDVARQFMTNEQQTALATYLIAKGRVNYYLHAGKLMMTSSDLMSKSNAQMVTAQGGKLVHGAFLATQRLMMLSSDANGPRTADTLFHEMTHSLFTALDDTNQVKFLKSLVPEFDDIADATAKTNPLYPVVLQLKAIDVYDAANPGKRGVGLQDMWRDPAVVEFWRKEGMSDERISVMQSDWYNSGHELFATALQNFITDFNEPTSMDASSAMDTDAAAIFQQVAGPIRSMWHKLSRENQPDIVMRNGKPYRSWASNVPVAKYTTGRGRGIDYPQVRQGDYVRLVIPNKSRLTTSRHDMFNLPDLLTMWTTTGVATNSTTHKFGFKSQATFTLDGQTVTHQVNAPIDNQRALSDIAGRLAKGRKVAFYVNPVGRNRTEMNTDRTIWGQRFNGRIVDQVILKTAGTDQQPTVFAYQMGGKTFSFASMKDNDGVHDSGFFKTRLEKTGDGYTTVPDVDSYFVLEAPVEVTMYEPNRKGTSASYQTNARWIVSADSLTNTEYNPQLLGFTGDFNPKFSAVLYDLNRKIDTVTRAVSNYHSYQDQLKFEKHIITGSPEDFRTDMRQGIDPKDRIAAYWSDQGKDVRAAGVDMYANMTTGRSSFENELLGLMRAQRLIGADGTYTEEGAMFIDDLNQFAVNPLAKYIDSQRLFRNSLRSFRFGELNAEGSAFEMRPGMPDYEALRGFHQKVTDALRNKAIKANVAPEAVSDFIEQGIEALYMDIYNAVNPRPLTRGEARSNKVALQDRVNEFISTFNSDVDEQFHLTTDAMHNGAVTDVVPLLQSVMQASGVGTSDPFMGYTTISEMIKGIELNQNLSMPLDAYQTNSAGYVLNRVTDVIFGRDNVVGKWEFMQRLASPDSNDRERAMQLAMATSHILDLQERQINTAKYKWNQYSLPSSAFADNGKVRIMDPSGRMMQVDFNKNHVQNIGIDHMRAGHVFKADVHSSRYPLFNPDAEVPFVAQVAERDQDGKPIGMPIQQEDMLVSSMTPIEQEQYRISKRGIVIMRTKDVSNPNGPDGMYFYRINKENPKTAAKTGIHFSVDKIVNPYSGYHISGDGPEDMTYVNNQRVMRQSPSKLMWLATQRYFDSATPDNYDAIERIRKTSIIQPEVYVAKMLVARAQRENPQSIPQAWKDGMRNNFRIKKAVANIGDETYDVLQSVLVNNSRRGTWLSSGELDSESGKPFSDYEMDLLRNLPEQPPLADNDQRLANEWKQQRYELIQEKLNDIGDPKNIVFKRHTDNDQVGIAVDGSDVHITIPSSKFTETLNVMFSSDPSVTTLLSEVPENGGTSMPLNTLPKDAPFWRTVLNGWTELSGMETAKRLSRDFARPMIQNFMLTAMNPKNTAMQFYGLLGMFPNLWFPHGSNHSAGVLGKMFGHHKNVALGDMQYHKIISGLFDKYGRKGSVIGYGIPGIHRATVGGYYDRETSKHQSYTIEDLNNLGLSTTYGEWYETAAAAQAQNPLMTLYDTPIQLTGAENLGTGVLAQRIIPFVGMTERGGVMSTDILRIKQFLEIARVVDWRIFDYLRSGASSERTAYYEAERTKREFARIINTISGTPVGEDPNVHPVARDLGYKLASVYTAPNWGKSLKAVTYLPMMIELAVAHGINSLLRPVWRKVFNGAEYNTLNVGAYHNYISAIRSFTTPGGITAKTPGLFDLQRKAAAAGTVAALGWLFAAMQTNIQERALLAAQGKPTEWYELAKINQMMTDMHASVEQQELLKPSKFGKVITLGNMQVQAPPIVMGLHRFVLAPLDYVQQKINDGESPARAIGETILRTEVTSRVNAMYSGAWNQITGRTFNNSALYQQHPGFYRFLQNPNFYLQRAGIYSLDLYRLQKMYPRGASRFAIEQEVLPVQKLMQDLELMEYQPDAQYNIGLSMAGRTFGLENNYSNVMVQKQIPGLKSGGITIGELSNEMKAQQYDYPNMFDMISQYGLWSLFEGIPGSGDIGGDGWESKQPVRRPGLPTQAVIDSSTERSERLRESMKEKKGKVTIPEMTLEQMNQMYRRGQEKMGR